jgi:hypothetical protein
VVAGREVVSGGRDSAQQHEGDQGRVDALERAGTRPCGRRYMAGECIYISVSEGTFKKGANNYMLLAKVISVACALSAAGFAIWSARIPVPDLLNTPMSGPGSITDIMNQQSRLSTIASFFAVVSAIAGVFA